MAIHRNLDLLGQLIDQYGSVLRAYQIKGLPTTYLVNRTGQIEYLNQLRRLAIVTNCGQIEGRLPTFLN